MTVEQLLTTTSGRISRRDYWKALGIVTLLVMASASAFRLIVYEWTAGKFPVQVEIDTLCRMDPETGTGMAYFIAMTLTMLVVGWIGYAYVAKRLHDVTLSGLLALAVVAPYLAVPVVSRFVMCPLADMPLEGAVEKLAALTPVLALTGLGFLAAMLQLYLGVQRGVVGPNRYGPDPLNGDASMPSSPAAAQNGLESAPDGQ